jgi:hypothetical protein
MKMYFVRDIKLHNLVTITDVVVEHTASISRVENGGSTFPRNVGNDLPHFISHVPEDE